MDEKLFNNYMTEIFRLYAYNNEELELRSPEDSTSVYLYCTKFDEPLEIAERTDEGTWILFLRDAFGTIIESEYLEVGTFYNNFFEIIYNDLYDDSLNLDDEEDDEKCEKISNELEEFLNDDEEEKCDSNIQIQVNKVINKN